ncbi:Kallikrein-1, partial [Galemys pyrenaicus]
DLGVWLGRQTIFPPERTVQFFKVSHRFPHPRFNRSLLRDHSRYLGEDYSHDLLLLRLNKPAKLTESVQVLGLPTREPAVGSTCYTSNWGSTYPQIDMFAINLQCVDLKLMPNQSCVKFHVQRLTEHMWCAGLVKRGQSLCGADSRGPLICEGQFQGLGSWDPYRCDHSRAPVIYTKLLEYVPWIRETMAAHT